MSVGTLDFFAMKSYSKCRMSHTIPCPWPKKFPRKRASFAAVGYLFYGGCTAGAARRTRGHTESHVTAAATPKAAHHVAPHVPFQADAFTLNLMSSSRTLGGLATVGVLLSTFTSISVLCMPVVRIVHEAVDGVRAALAPRAVAKHAAPPGAPAGCSPTPRASSGSPFGAAPLRGYATSHSDASSARRHRPAAAAGDCRRASFARPRSRLPPRHLRTGPP